MDELNKIHHRDFLHNDLPDRCCRLIIADPPYFEVKGEFDFVWPTFDDYLKDVRLWAAECKRLLAPNGTLLWYGPAKKIAYSQIILDELFDLINNLVWHKGDFMNLEHSSELRSFAPCTERLLMYANETENATTSIYQIRDYIRTEIEKCHGKISLKQINEALGAASNGGGVASTVLSLNKTMPGMITAEMYEKLQDYCPGYMLKRYEDLRSEYELLRRYFSNDFKLSEVLEFSNESSKTGAKHDHETVKPETLTRALIITLSRPGDLVGIPFTGSGTECAMAARENRPFVGYETNPKHVRSSNRRADKEKQTPQLFQ